MSADAGRAISRRTVRLPGREFEQLLGAAVPSDHARQTVADVYIDRELGRVASRRWRVLDLGCGAGGSVELFRAHDPDVDWIGLDIPGSREAGARRRTDARFATFDGVSIPFADESFDLVYCKQVLEHVRHPAPLLRDVRRVLAGGGYFAGSTSQLEPFHSLSLWNYTPVGLARLLEDAGLSLLEIRPGIDALALIARRVAGRRSRFEGIWARWWGGRSPLNRAIDGYGRVRRLDARALNATKLVFCGQFTFLAARRP
ncbi:MAG: class I SAM-dependent methyltransferase [Solirubrobacterales bacterium]|nr:class I SAM-dependent methyltransferase [Solirubrobacterales bacterium]